MSATVSAVPFLLIYAIAGASSLISGIVQGVANSYGTKANKLHLDEEIAEKMFNQEFQTQIVDKDTLLKTLKEHGATKIEEYSQNISCDCEQFHLEFTYNGDKPYTMKISANDSYGLEDLVNDISEEYTSNAQEISYNKIKERLKNKNLEINEEEILEDNTIVLTINLD